VSRLVPLSFGTRRVDDCHRGHENTDYLINRLLRQSIINSVADTLFMVLGFFLAR